MLKLYEYNLKSRKGLILQWNDGWGEIAPLPGFSKETLEEAREEILSLLPDLKNAKPKLPSVRFGIESASKPFSIEPINIPLCALNRADGFSTAKFKVGHLSLEDAIALAKRHLHLRLRLDFNRKWPLEKALAFTKHFKPDDFDYLEDPVEDLQRFSEMTNFPIAVDSAAWQGIPSLKAVVIKPTVVGYIPKLPAHVQLILSSSYESGIGLLNIARLAQELKLDNPMGLDTVWQDDILNSPIRCSDGMFSWNYPCTPAAMTGKSSAAPITLLMLASIF